MARRLRIVQVTATFPPYYAGTGNVCFQQARCLAERGHRVEVWTATYPGDADDPPGVRVRRARPLLRLGNAPLISGLVAAGRDADLIHLHQPFIFGAELTALGALATRVPIVSSFHNALDAGGVKGALFAAYNATALRLALARSARFTVLSLDHAAAVPELARELARRPAAFTEVPNGVDAGRFAPRRGERTPGPPVAVFAAALDAAHRFKRLDLLLDALAEVPELRLRVVGGGELLGEFRRMAAERGVADRVGFTGPRPHDELPGVLSAADFLVLCSDSVESFGLVQVEAMACGLPVIAPDLPGVRSVVRDGVDGFHVVPGDRASLVAALRRLSRMDPGERAAMGASGRARVLAEYTWERSAERLEGVYREVVT